MDNAKSCGCFCHKMKGVFAVLFGLTFLLKELGVIGAHAANITWPAIVILAGLKMLTKGMCKCCSES